MPITRIKQLLAPIHQYIIWLLIGILIGGVLASTISYPLRVASLKKIMNVCSDVPNDSIIIVKVSAFGKITNVICDSGIDLKIKN